MLSIQYPNSFFEIDIPTLKKATNDALNLAFFAGVGAASAQFIGHQFIRLQQHSMHSLSPNLANQVIRICTIWGAIQGLVTLYNKRFVNSETHQNRITLATIGIAQISALIAIKFPIFFHSLSPEKIVNHNSFPAAYCLLSTTLINGIWLDYITQRFNKFNVNLF